MLSRTLVLISLSTGAVALTGCGNLGAIADIIDSTRETRVVLRNQGDFPVEVSLFYDNDQDTIDGLIQETGTERQFTIDDGLVESFSLDCDDLQAIIIDKAELSIIGDIGPEESTSLLRDGSDFGCGDTVTFTFTHSDSLTDLMIDTNVTSE